VRNVKAAGQNNSSQTPIAASVAKSGWELIITNSSHYCFVPVPCLLRLGLAAPAFGGHSPPVADEDGRARPTGRHPSPFLYLFS
jgi:hypothetical protein